MLSVWICPLLRQFLGFIDVISDLKYRMSDVVSRATSPTINITESLGAPLCINKMSTAVGSGDVT